MKQCPSVSALTSMTHMVEELPTYNLVWFWVLFEFGLSLRIYHDMPTICWWVLYFICFLVYLAYIFVLPFQCKHTGYTCLPSLILHYILAVCFVVVAYQLYLPFQLKPGPGWSCLSRQLIWYFEVQLRIPTFYLQWVACLCKLYKYINQYFKHFNPPKVKCNVSNML